MIANARRIMVLAAISGACLGGAINTRAASQEDEATTMMKSYEEQQRSEAAARNKDSTWKPSCKEVSLIQVSDSRNPQALKNFCLTKEGDILACYAGAGNSSDAKNA